MRCLQLMVLLLLPSTALSAEISIRVSYPDGAPAQGVKVQEVGLERGNIHSDLVGTTDNHGRFATSIRIKPRTIPEDLRGYYVYAYRYVVMPDEFQWEVSDISWTVFPDQDSESFEKNFSNRENWSIGKKVKISQDTRIEWNIVLKKSFDTKVAFRDQSNNPIRNARVSFDLDLQAQSHTGFGGSIRVAETKTDASGDIILRNPGDFFYSFSLLDQRQYMTPDLDYWSDTITQRLADGDNVITFHRCVEKPLRVVVWDKVTGEPVSGASILVTMKFAGAIQGGPLGAGIVTDANGTYMSDDFCTGHLVEFGVAKEGYRPSLMSIDNYSPGNFYRFRLEPEAK